MESVHNVQRTRGRQKKTRCRRIQWRQRAATLTSFQKLETLRQLTHNLIKARVIFLKFLLCL